MPQPRGTYTAEFMGKSGASIAATPGSVEGPKSTLKEESRGKHYVVVVNVSKVCTRDTCSPV